MTIIRFSLKSLLFKWMAFERYNCSSRSNIFPSLHSFVNTFSTTNIFRFKLWRCVHVLQEIFLQSQLLLLTLSLTFIFTTCSHITHSRCSSTLLVHAAHSRCSSIFTCSFCPPFCAAHLHAVIPQLVTPSVIPQLVNPSGIVIYLSSLLIVTPRFTPSVVSSSPLMCWFLVRGLSTHYFSSQLGMTWSSHINLIGKLEKRSCYKHSREDTNDFGAQTV